MISVYNINFANAVNSESWSNYTMNRDTCSSIPFCACWLICFFFLYILQVHFGFLCLKIFEWHDRFWLRRFFIFVAAPISLFSFLQFSFCSRSYSLSHQSTNFVPCPGYLFCLLYFIYFCILVQLSFFLDRGGGGSSFCLCSLVFRSLCPPTRALLGRNFFLRRPRLLRVFYLCLRTYFVDPRLTFLKQSSPSIGSTLFCYCWRR